MKYIVTQLVLGIWLTADVLSEPSLIPYTPDPTNDFTPTLYWNSVSGASQYRIEIDSNSTFSSPIVNDTIASTDFTSGIDLPSGDIYWHVSSDLNYTDFSPTDHFVITRAPLLIPYSTDPTSDFTPTLYWNSLSGATNYRVQVDDNISFSSPLEYTTTSGDTNYTTGSLWQGNVYWRVSSNKDDFTEYCPYDHFTISTAPTLLAYSPDPTPDMTPTLSWNPVSGATEYKIQLDDDPAFPAPLSYSVSAATSYSVNLPNENTWYWRVSSDIDTTYFSNYDSFTYQKPQINKFNGLAVYTNYPNFTWSSYPGANNYNIEINDDITFTTPIYSGTTSGATSYDSTYLSTSSTYFWRVSTDHDYTAYSDIDSVRISQGPELVTFGGDTTDETWPVFKWHPVSGASSYTFEIDTNINFLTNALSYPTDTFTTSPNELSPDKYYWRVSSDLDTMDYSNPDSLVIIDTMTSWHVSTSGDSGNSGAATSPLDSLNRALDKASPGDTIKIALGTYVLTDFSYVQDSTLVILGGYSDDFTLRNSDSLLTLFDAQNTYTVEVLSNGKGAIIDGITFKNSNPVSYFLKLSYTDSVTISNCRFILCYKGVELHETNNSKILNNILAFNTIALYIDYHSSNIEVINNTFSRNAYGVMEGEMVSGILIKNNIYAFNIYGIFDSLTVTDTITYNSFYGDSIHYRDYSKSDFSDVALIDTCERHSNNLLLDPEFIDTAYASYDFHLSPSSQCKDNGDPGFTYASEPAPNGGRINLGAYGNTQWATISGTMPNITTMPLSDTVEIGGNAVFSVTATGTPSLSYQWQKNGSNITGATGSSYSIDPVVQNDSGWYKVTVSTIVGDVVSDSAYLLVPTPIAITSQPSDAVVLLGNPFTLSVSATGQPPLEFTWFKSGTDSSGALNEMSIGNVSLSDTGFYLCKVYNQFDTAWSDTAKITVHTPPVADFTGSPTLGIDTATVLFSDQSTGTIDQFIWDFGDGTIDTLTTQSDVSHFYSAIGTYNVSLTVKNLTFSIDSTLLETGYINVVSKSFSTFSGTPVMGIDSLTVQFSLDSVSSSVSEWIWTYGDGTIDTFTSAVNPTHHFETPGAYDVKLKVSGPGGIDSTVREQYINVYTGAVSKFTASDTLGYAPLTVTFYDSSIGDIDSWNWEFGDDDTSSIQNPTHEYIKRGAFEVKLIVSGLGGNDTLIRNNYITALNTPPVISLPEIDSLHEDSLETILVNVTDVNNDTVTLSFLNEAPNGMSLNQVSHTLSWTPGNDDVGNHIFTIIADDNHGGKDMAVCTLTVYNTNDFPVIDSIIFPDTALEDSLMSGMIIASDPDLYDSLILRIDSTVNWLNINKKLINQSSWYFTIQGTPGDSDTGLIELKAIVSDREGLKTDTSWTIFILNKDDAPETKLVKKEVMYGAARYTFIAEDEFDSITYYIRIQSAGIGFDSLFTNNNGHVSLYPLLDGIYYISCYSVDSGGLSDPTPVFDTLVVSGGSTHSMTNDNIWNMISIPCSELDATPLKNGGDILHWDESQGPNGIYKHYIRTKDITNIAPGNSYWTRQDSSINITLKENDLFRKDSIILDLHKDKFGWNQIASPYPYPVKWNSTLTLWEWDPYLRDFIESESVLYPWNGYWVHTETSGETPIYSKPIFLNKRMSRRIRTYFVNKKEWTFRISLISNLNRDRDNLFGFSREAHNGPDDLDRPEPPRMDNEPFIFFPHPEWESSIDEFASDIRHTWNSNKNIFQVGISSCSKDITDMALTISGYKSDMPIYLFVNTSKGVVQYFPQKAITIKPSNEKQYRTIFVTDDRNFLKNFPFKFTLNHPYPNPCHPMTTIHYTLPYRWQKNGWLNDKPYEVSIRIYDIRGRVIRELVNRKQSPDRYSVVWRGKSNTNRMVVPGFYLIRLVAGKYTSSRKIIVFR